jgi:site-specific recombinase XerD
LELRELELWRQGHDVSLNMLKSNTIQDSSDSFLEFIKEEIAESSSKESTKRNRISTLKLLVNFKGVMRMDEVTIQFVYDFETYLHRKGYNVNTIAKHMKHVRFFVNTAINKGLLEAKDYPFHRYKIKTKESEHTFLLPEELQKLEELSMSINHFNESHVLDAFLFCCYTGVRFSDFINLSERNFIYIDNNPWIVFHTIKTGTEIKLPLHLLFEGKGFDILQKYQNNVNAFFALQSNSKTNKVLGYISQLAGIEKHLSFHVARHTNATLLLYKGVSITTVQKLLGHRNISTTQIYSEVLNRTIIRDLERCI